MDAHRHSHNRERQKPRPVYRKKQDREKRSPLGNPLYYLVLLAALATIGGVVLYGRFGGDPEVREIERLIHRGAQSVMDEDVTQCLAVIDESYRDNQGNSYESIRREAHDASGRGFDDVSDINIRIRNIKVQLAANRVQGTATFEMRFTAKIDDRMGRKIPIAGVLGNHNPLASSWESVTISGAKRDGQWRIAQLEVEPLRK